MVAVERGSGGGVLFRPLRPLRDQEDTNLRQSTTMLEAAGDGEEERGLGGRVAVAVGGWTNNPFSIVVSQSNQLIYDHKWNRTAYYHHFCRHPPWRRRCMHFLNLIFILCALPLLFIQYCWMYKESEQIELKLTTHLDWILYIHQNPTL